MFTKHQNGFLHAAAGIVLFFQISCIWFFTYLPLQDYYEWLIQSKILLNLCSGDDFTRHYYFCSFSPIPPPNAFLNIFMAALQIIVSTKISGKIILTIYILLFNLGFYRYCQKTMDGHPLRFIGLLFTFNLFFYMGFLSYILGISLFLLGLPIFSTSSSSIQKKSLQIFVVSLFLYLVHGFAFGLFILAFMVWFIRLNWKSGRIRNSLIPIAAVLPSVTLTIVYIIYLPSSRGEPFDWHDSIFHQLQNLRYGFTNLQRIALMDNTLPLTFLNLLILFFVGLIFFRSRKYFSIKSFSGVSVAIFAAIMIFNPVYRIGDFYPINSRFSVVIIPLLSGAFVFSRRKPNLEILIIAVALFISISHAAQFRQFNQLTRPIIARLESQYKAAQSPFVLSRVNIDDFERSPLNIFSSIIQPYIFTEGIFNTDSLRFFVPIHATSIVHVRKNEETTVKTYVDNLFDGLRTRQYFVDAIKKSKDSLFANFDKIFIVGTRTTQKEMTSELNPEFVQTNELDLWIVLERKASFMRRKAVNFWR